MARTVSSRVRATIVFLFLAAVAALRDSTSSFTAGYVASSSPFLKHKQIMRQKQIMYAAKAKAKAKGGGDDEEEDGDGGDEKFSFTDFAMNWIPNAGVMAVIGASTGSKVVGAFAQSWEVKNLNKKAGAKN